MADLPRPPDSATDSGSGPGPGDLARPGDESDRVADDQAAAGGPAEPSLGEIVATARDIVLYAPIALVLDAPTLLPKLAEQGKQHMRNARALGPHALRKIQNRLVATAGTVSEQAGEVLRQLGVTPGPAAGEADGRERPGTRARGDGRSDAGPTRHAGPVTGAGASGAAGGDGADGTAVVDRTSGHDPGPSRGVDDGREAAPPSPAVDELAIPDYDSLSALQVVDRLPGLTPAELEAVRAYEAAHRGRKTILNKAAQLQA